MGAPVNGRGHAVGSMWIRDDVAGMPSMARFRYPTEQQGWYVVVDPTANRLIGNDGSTRAARLPRWASSSLVVATAAICGLIALALPDASGPLVFPVGALTGVVLSGSLVIGLSWVIDHQERSRLSKFGVAISWRVGPRDGRAWRLCQTAARIGLCTSWRDGTIDADRQVPSILWSAVGRSLSVDRRKLDAERALNHESLRDLAQQSLAAARDEAKSLDAVEENLQQVLMTAWNVDQRRRQTAREALDSRRRKAEEQELRARLVGSDHVNDAESHWQADRSAGLAAEVAAVSDLLAATDHLLRGLGGDVTR